MCLIGKDFVCKKLWWTANQNYMKVQVKKNAVDIRNVTEHFTKRKQWVESRKWVIPVVCVKLGKLYVVKHNCVTWGVFNDYMMDNYMFRPVLAIVRLS